MRESKINSKNKNPTFNEAGFFVVDCKALWRLRALPARGNPGFEWSVILRARAESLYAFYIFVFAVQQ
jgi:hypothetical protein